MTKRWILPACLVLALGILISSRQTTQKKISKEIGIDVTNAELLSEVDTHGGFHGDGISCVALQLDAEVAQTISQAPGWKTFPLDQTTKTLLYGVTQKTAEGLWKQGPYLRGNDERPLVPRIESGYYLLLDRHSEAKPDQDPAEILQRASLNLTVAVYDDVNGILYVCRLDT